MPRGRRWRHDFGPDQNAVKANSIAQQQRRNLQRRAPDHVLTVGDENNYFAARAVTFEKLFAGRETFADRGSSRMIGFLQRIESPFMIERERRHEKWTARETHDANAI